MKKTDTKNGDGLKHDFTYEPEEATRHLSAADPILGELMRRAGPFTLEVRSLHSPFESLARNIIYQQLHGKAAAAIHGRVVTLCGKKSLHAADLVNASDLELRGAGLSAAKLAALRDLAAKTLDGTIPTLARLRRMDDEQIIERLTTVRGIGRWTVEMLLMSGLGRPDVLPVGDFAVRKGFMLAYGLEAMPKPKELEEYAELWRPYRTVASWYMWRVLELPPDALPLQPPSRAGRKVSRRPA